MKVLPRLYFAHPINTYQTALERRCMGFLHASFPDHVIVSPGSAAVRARVEDIASRFSPEEYNTKGSKEVMDFFLNELVPSCDTYVALQNPDTTFMSGIGAEALRAHELGQTMWRLTHTLALTQIIDPRREMVVLTREETRERIYHWPTRALRPYPVDE